MGHKPTKIELDAKAHMLAKFGDQHRPSLEQWQALDHILESLDRMRSGKTASKVFLSSIDPGVGKTVTLTSYLKAYLQSDDQAGALICINSWREIETLLHELRPHLKSVAVWCPASMTFNDAKMRREHRTKGLVSATELAQDRSTAKILIATHIKISQQIHRHGSAATTSSIFYKDKPRRIRVWDESWLPTDPLTILCAKLYDALSTLSFHNQDAFQTLSEFMYLTTIATHNATLSFPNLREDHGLTFDHVDEIIEAHDLDPEIRDVLYLLVRVSGLTVSIYSDGAFGNTALTFEDTSPFAMAPLLVLDASGRVQDVYQDLINRDVVHPMRSAAKDYSPLEIAVWERGGGKSSFEAAKLDHIQITEEIIKLIAERPDERWLVVCHKESNHFKPIVNIGPAICQHFGNPENIKFITWGQHRASNEFVEYENIVLAGLLYMRESQYATLKRVSLGLRPEHEGDLPSALIAKVRLGEHKNHILQALCRIRVRQSDDHRCLPARAYLIAPRNSGLKRQLPTIFPGLAEIQSWGEPEKLKLTSDQKRTGRHIVQYFMTTPGIDRLHITSTAKALGFAVSNFRRDVRERKAFRVALESYGVHEYGRRKSKGKRTNKTHWEVFDRSLLPEATLNHFFSQGHPA